MAIFAIVPHAVFADSDTSNDLEYYYAECRNGNSLCMPGSTGCTCTPCVRTSSNAGSCRGYWRGGIPDSIADTNGYTTVDTDDRPTSWTPNININNQPKPRLINPLIPPRGVNGTAVQFDAQWEPELAKVKYRCSVGGADTYDDSLVYGESYTFWNNTCQVGQAGCTACATPSGASLYGWDCNNITEVSDSFTGTYTSGQVIANPSFTPDATYLCSAIWSYNITYYDYDANNTNITNSYAASYRSYNTHDLPKNLPDITTTGYNCDWHSGSANGAVATEIPTGSTGAKSFYKVCTPKTYRVQYSCYGNGLGGGGTDSGTQPSGGDTATYDSSYTFNGGSYCTPPSGYALDYWDCSAPVNTHTPNAQVTWNYDSSGSCEAIWKVDTWYVSYR